MCLTTKKTDEEKKEFLDSLTFPLKAYKIVRIGDDDRMYGLYSETYHFEFQNGKNIDPNTKAGETLKTGWLLDEEDREEYKKGFHCLLHKNDALRLFEYSLGDRWQIIEVTIEKAEHIVEVGEEGCSRVIVVEELTMGKKSWRTTCV